MRRSESTGVGQKRSSSFVAKSGLRVGEHGTDHDLPGTGVGTPWQDASSAGVIAALRASRRSVRFSAAKPSRRPVHPRAGGPRSLRLARRGFQTSARLVVPVSRRADSRAYLPFLRARPRQTRETVTHPLLASPALSRWYFIVLAVWRLKHEVGLRCVCVLASVFSAPRLCFLNFARFTLSANLCNVRVNVCALIL